MSPTYRSKPYWLYIWLNVILFSKNCFSASETEDLMVSCIESIMEKYTNPEDLVYQINLNSSLKFPVVQYDPRKPFHVRNVRKPDVYVIYAGTDLYMLEQIFNMTYTNPRAKFIIVFKEISWNVLYLLSHYYIYRVVLLRTDESGVITLYSNYSHGNNLTFVGPCSEIHKLREDDLFQYRPPTKPNNLTVLVVPYYPYAINVTSTDFVGIEISLVNLIASHLNVELTYVKSGFEFWGHIGNKNFTHALGELKSRRYDFAIGGFHLEYYESLHFDVSIAYLKDAVKLIAPKARLRQVSSTSFFRIFQRTLWIMYIVSMLTFFVIFYALRACTSNTFKLLTILENTLFFVQLVVEAGVRFNARYKSMHFFLMLCIFFVFSINTTFKSQLLLLFSEKMFEHQIDVIEDIMESKIKVGYYYSFNNSFKNYGSDAEKYIYENSILCELNWSCMNRTARQRDLVTAQSDGEMRYHTPRLFVDSEGRALLHITNIVVRPIPIHIFFIKGYPLFDKINNYLMTLRDNGFVSYHYKETDFLNKIALEKATYNSRKLLEKSLNLKKLTRVFYFYYVGALLSTVTFLIEVFLFYFKL